jgi:hypothetical protein
MKISLMVNPAGKRRQSKSAALHAGFFSMTAALFLLCGCGSGERQQAALRAGRDAAAPCIERFHDQGHTYAECVRYVAGFGRAPAAQDDVLAPWQRLGALQAGWITAAQFAQAGDADGRAAAQRLLADAAALHRELHVQPRQLCALMPLDCQRQLQLYAELIASREREVIH